MKKKIFCKIKQYPLLKSYYNEILAYLEGQIINFSALQIPTGTKFQRTVWQACRTIPYGQTISYMQLAMKINCQSAQAVGTALKNNPCTILIPCHRVVEANGKYGQYSLGDNIKKWLINHETKTLKVLSKHHLKV